MRSGEQELWNAYVRTIRERALLANVAVRFGIAVETYSALGRDVLRLAGVFADAFRRGCER